MGDSFDMPDSAASDLVSSQAHPVCHAVFSVGDPGSLIAAPASIDDLFEARSLPDFKTIIRRFSPPFTSASTIHHGFLPHRGDHLGQGRPGLS